MCPASSIKGPFIEVAKKKSQSGASSMSKCMTHLFTIHLHLNCFSPLNFSHMEMQEKCRLS